MLLDCFSAELSVHYEAQVEQGKKAYSVFDTPDGLQYVLLKKVQRQLVAIEKDEDSNQHECVDEEQDEVHDEGVCRDRQLVASLADFEVYQRNRSQEDQSGKQVQHALNQVVVLKQLQKSLNLCFVFNLRLVQIDKFAEVDTRLERKERVHQQDDQHAGFETDCEPFRRQGDLDDVR